MILVVMSAASFLTDMMTAFSCFLEVMENEQTN